MPKEREKVKCKTELEFITEVADDCVANLKDKDREHLIRNPYAIDYHFSYCLYIRNHYIHNRDFSDVDFWTEPDDLSSEIIRMIFAKLIPEYDYDNQFIENLFDDKRFIQLRQEYRAIYGDYPVAMVEEYKEGISFEPALFMSEISSSNNVDIDKEIEVSKKNHEKSCAHIEKLLKKLAEKVWRLDQLRQTAEECGIDYEELIPKIQEIQKILFEDREYIPVEVCLLGNFINGNGIKRIDRYLFHNYFFSLCLLWHRLFCFSRNELSRTFYQKNKQQYYLLHYACCVCHLAV